jgi:predicted DNA-binding transcriptional regulator AlpA
MPGYGSDTADQETRETRTRRSDRDQDADQGKGTLAQGKGAHGTATRKPRKPADKPIDLDGWERLAFLSMSQLCALLALSAPTIYRAIARGEFPQGYKLVGSQVSGGRVGWKPSEIAAWIETRQRCTGEPRSGTSGTGSGGSGSSAVGARTIPVSPARTARGATGRGSGHRGLVVHRRSVAK